MRRSIMESFLQATKDRFILQRAPVIESFVVPQSLGNSCEIGGQFDWRRGIVAKSSVASIPVLGSARNVQTRFATLISGSGSTVRWPGQTGFNEACSGLCTS